MKEKPRPGKHELNNRLGKNLEPEGPLDLARAFLFIRGDFLAGLMLPANSCSP